MSIKRYVAASSREAMERVRRELGDDAVILSNRKLGPHQVEILAAAGQAMEALVEHVAPRPHAAAGGRGVEARGIETRGIEPRGIETRDPPPSARGRVPAPRTPQGDVRRTDDRPGASPAVHPATVRPESFQDYVRRQTAARAAEDAAARLRLHEAAGGTGAALYGAVAATGHDDTPAGRPAHRTAPDAAMPLARRAGATGLSGSPAADAARASVQASAREAAHEIARELAREAARPATAAARPATRGQRADTTSLPDWAPPEWFAEAAPPAPAAMRDAHGQSSGTPPALRLPGAPPATAPVAGPPAVFRRRPSRLAVPGAVEPASVPAAMAPAALALAPLVALAAPMTGAAAANEPAAPPAPMPVAVPAAAVSVPAAATRPALPTAQAAPPAPPPAEVDPRVLAEIQSLRQALNEQLDALSSVLMTRVDAKLDATLGRALVSDLAATLVNTLAPTVAAATGAAASAAASQALAAARPARAPEPEPTVARAAAPAVQALPAAAPPASATPVPAPAAMAAPASRAASPTQAAPAGPATPAAPATSAAPATPAAPAAAVTPALLHGPSTSAMTRLLMAGFSADVARRISAHVTADFPRAQIDDWLQQVLVANLRCEPDLDALVAQGGAVALVGPTGVGKTTTVAKLAARCVVQHGAGQLGLVTLDAYRVGAHEQLQAYGRILGVPVHLARDAATLRDLMQAMRGRRLVLIDTCGLSQRDPRLAEMLGMLDAAGLPGRPVRRVLLLHAAAHAESLDEVARAWQAPLAHGAVLTKLDEAARIGGVLDTLLRWKLTLLGLTNGQRVPEDWHAANARLLAHIALKPAGEVFALQPGELAESDAVASPDAHRRAAA